MELFGIRCQVEVEVPSKQFIGSLPLSTILMPMVRMRRAIKYMGWTRGWW